MHYFSGGFKSCKSNHWPFHLFPLLFSLSWIALLICITPRMFVHIPIWATFLELWKAVYFMLVWFILSYVIPMKHFRSGLFKKKIKKKFCQVLGWGLVASFSVLQWEYAEGKRRHVCKFDTSVIILNINISQIYLGEKNCIFYTLF